MCRHTEKNGWIIFIADNFLKLLRITVHTLILQLSVMDRCKSSQSGSDSPISPNLICLKNAALALRWLLPPFLLTSDPLLLILSSLFLLPYSTLVPHSLKWSTGLLYMPPILPSLVVFHLFLPAFFSMQAPPL